MTSTGHQIIIDKEKTTISGHNFELKYENKDGSYILSIDRIIEKNESVNMWHKRLGHARKDALTQLVLKLCRRKGDEIFFSCK